MYLGGAIRKQFRLTEFANRTDCTYMQNLPALMRQQQLPNYRYACRLQNQQFHTPLRLQHS